MAEYWKYFQGSLLVTFAGVLAAFFMGGLETVFIVSVLTILEVSLSFDNAVVNAKVLKDMDAVWRRRFLTWGILIAVVGMRIIFPLIIVGIVSGVSPWQALFIAINEPQRYASSMEAAHVSVMAFGGAFLMMVGLKFFFDSDKDNWLPLIEKPLAKLERFSWAAESVTALLVLLVGFLMLHGDERQAFLLSAFSGLVVFSLIHKLNDVMEERERIRSANMMAKSGAAMFLYLELLDSSFSFDGVVGAFAITTDLFVIAIGLGIGAMFVRSLTILLVEKETLTQYRYLEHGAFYAIVALASIMFIKTFAHVSEMFTGLIGAGFIAVAYVHSLWLQRQEANAEQH